ncbi:alpha/beta hydrolase [Streptomyces shenzhenensis]|uniref:alpha/beta hydrolase n=1 Tax=Streptomyces shenzhenensis TaxID=943815 RepID=UPI003F5420BA
MGQTVGQAVGEREPIDPGVVVTDVAASGAVEPGADVPGGDVAGAGLAGGVGSRRAPRRRGARWVRALLAGLITAAVVAPLSAAARPEVPAPAPASLAPPIARTLSEGYAANRANAAEAARMAAAHGADRRAAADRSMAAPARQFLVFDGRGSGRATEVFGDLAHADRVAVLVPGSDTSIDTYDRFRRAAAALYGELVRGAPPGSRPAVLAWLGYDTPGTVSTAVLTTGRAEQAAPRLRALVGDVRRVTGGRAHITLVCHSYGSVVCGRAAAGLDVDALAVVGSPGTGADSAAALHTPARVWAARGSGDWVADVPHIRAELLGTTVGFGTDPVSPAFGARLFDAADADHSGYFTPGSTALLNLARIALGETPEVTHA